MFKLCVGCACKLSFFHSLYYSRLTDYSSSKSLHTVCIKYVYKIKYTQQITTDWRRRRRLRYNIKNNTKNSLIHKRKIVNENNNFHTLCTIFTSNESSEWVREGGRGRAVKSRHIEAHDDRCFFFRWCIPLTQNRGNSLAIFTLFI